MGRETDVLLEHEVDGIREYDNPMPAWWLGIFYVTIAFAVVFPPYLYVTGWSQEGQYDASVAAAETSAALVAEARARKAASEPKPEGGGAVLGDAAAGAELWATRCVACHKADGTGGIGPNLTDDEWIHGGTPEAIVKTVTEGVPAKGMLAWGPLLGEQGVADVSAYVHGLGGGQ